MSAVVACFAVYVTHRLVSTATVLLRQEIERAEQAKREAERNAAEKARFLAFMGHELRSPLGAILGVTELLGAENPREKQIERIGLIRDSASSLLHVIDKTLDHSRLENRMVDLDEVEFCLPKLIVEIIDLLSVGMDTEAVKMIFVPDQDSPVQFLGDPFRIRQILINLLSNAIKFTKEGVIKVSYSMERKSTEGQRLRVEVSDTGIGIPDDLKGKLFEDYVQADAAVASQHGGSGLGLSITKQLVELMGGEIGVESEPDAGSTFWISVDCTPVS